MENWDLPVRASPVYSSEVLDSIYYIVLPFVSFPDMKVLSFTPHGR